MKYLVTFCTILDDHIFATPKPTSEQIVETDSKRKLQKYIESKKDLYGNPFIKSVNNIEDFNYISKQGGVKVVRYTEPTIIKL